MIINNSNPTANTLLTDFDEGDIQGLDGAPVRKQIDNAGTNERWDCVRTWPVRAEDRDVHRETRDRYRSRR